MVTDFSLPVYLQISAVFFDTVYFQLPLFTVLLFAAVAEKQPDSADITTIAVNKTAVSFFTLSLLPDIYTSFFTFCQYSNAYVSIIRINRFVVTATRRSGFI